MKKILFLDLDGTVRQTKSGQTFINDPNDQQLIEGVSDKIKLYSEFFIIGVTNQAGVAAGKKTLNDAIAEQKITLDLLPELSDIYFCPDFQGEQCYFVSRLTYLACHNLKGFEDLKGLYRKPNPGIIKLALRCYDINLDPSDCLMVGDMESDQECAKAAGVPFIWASDWLRKD